MNVREQYESSGFFINGKRRLPADLVTRAADGMNAIRRGEYDTGRPPEGPPWKDENPERSLCKIEMPQFASQAVLELVSHPLIGQLAAEATGASWVQVWWVQLLYKPPTPAGLTTHTNVGWHQDRHYWQCWTPESELLTAWVALSDVTRDSGPMLFVPGSHKWGVQAGSDFHGQQLDDIRSRIKIPEGESWQEVSAILPPGGFSLHHSLTWHASGPNHSSLPRMAFAIHLRTENSRAVSDQRAGLTKYIDDTEVCPIIYNGDSARNPDLNKRAAAR